MAQQRSGRGFAALPTSELRRISSAGGRASHESGHGHEWTSQEAREAGKRGGRTAQPQTQSEPPPPASSDGQVSLDRGADPGDHYDR